MGGLAQAMQNMCLKAAIVTAKTTADATIAVTGIATEDKIVACIRFGATAGSVTDSTSTVTITAAGLIANSAAVAAGKYFLLYQDVSI